MTLPKDFFLIFRKECYIYTCVQVRTFHDGCKQGIEQQILIGNQFNIQLRILSPYSYPGRGTSAGGR